MQYRGCVIINYNSVESDLTFVGGKSLDQLFINYLKFFKKKFKDENLIKQISISSKNSLRFITDDEVSVLDNVFFNRDEVQDVNSFLYTVIGELNRLLNTLIEIKTFDLPYNTVTILSVNGQDLIQEPGYDRKIELFYSLSSSPETCETLLKEYLMKDIRYRLKKDIPSEDIKKLLKFLNKRTKGKTTEEGYCGEYKTVYIPNNLGKTITL